VNGKINSGFYNCECAEGYKMVNWECLSCDQLVSGCNTCDTTKCLTCKSDFDMVSSNGLMCLPKFENCVIPIAN